MNLTKDVKDILISRGVTSPVYRSICPDGDDVLDDILVLYEYAGLPLNGLDTSFAGLSLQVVTRAPDFDAGLTRAQAVSAMLRDIGNTDKKNQPVVVNNTAYYQFAALQSPFKLKEDEAGRIYFAQNFRVSAREK